MSTNFVLNAELREDHGKGASRRLRRADKVPAILYGGEQEPTALALPHNELLLQLENEAFYSHILTVKLPKGEEQAILRDVQRHPYRAQIVHVDLQRVSQDKEIHVHVPLHFINEDKCAGVKLGGGILSKTLTEVEVSCLPKDLPEYIEIDVQNLQLGDSVHLTEMQLPAGVRLLALAHGDEHDTAVVSVHKTRTAAEDEAPAEAAGGVEGGAADAPKS